MGGIRIDGEVYHAVRRCKEKPAFPALSDRKCIMPSACVKAVWGKVRGQNKILAHAKTVGNLRARYRVHKLSLALIIEQGNSRRGTPVHRARYRVNKLPQALKYRFARARCRVKKLVQCPKKRPLPRALSCPETQITPYQSLARCRVKKFCERASSCITRSCVIPPLQLHSVLARENET